MAQEAELFDGTVLEFPDGTAPDVIARVAKQQTAERQSRVGSPAMDAVTPREQAAPDIGALGRQATAEMVQQPGALDARNDADTAQLAAAAAATPVKPRTMMDAILDNSASVAQSGLGLLGNFGRGARRGVSMLAGAPVDLVNNAPRLVNLMPGVSGVGPMTDRPFGGSESIDSALGGFGLIPDVQPQTTAQGIAQRVGQEIGANALPVGAAVGIGSRMAPQAARAMQTAAPAIAPTSSIPGAQAVQQVLNNTGNAVRGVAGSALEAAAVNPAGVVGRETAYATAAGLGAGGANAIAGNPQHGDNAVSDFVGSMAGVLGLAGASGIATQGKNLVNAAAGTPVFRTDVVNEAVASNILNNSSDVAAQAAASPRGMAGVDTTPLAYKLRQPSEAENTILGYRANIADRTKDPAMATYVFNAEAAAPGAAALRRAGNEEAVSNAMEAVAPGGDPAQFRAALEANRAQRIAAAEDSAYLRQREFDTAAQTAQPAMPDATQRGAALRESLAERYAQEQDRVREAYRPVDEARVPVDAAPVAERFQTVTEGLPLNDRQRFLPAEADVPRQLGTDGNTVVPLTELTSIRSGLGEDIRGALATPGQGRRAMIGGQYQTQLDEYLSAILPPEIKSQLDAANSMRRNVADRFERSGTGIAETLKPREGGGYALDDSAVTNRFTPTDQGRVADMQAVLSEVGQNGRARQAIADEVLSDVNRRGLAEKPAELRRYLGERNILLDAFPELRDRLGGVASARENAIISRDIADATNRRLTTPSQSPEAAYLKFDDARTVDAVRSVTTSADPGKAARTLIEAAGDTPEALRNGRAALWKVVEQQKMAAPGVTGTERWNGRKIKAMFDDPKTAAVAKELWRDAPEDLAAIKQVGEALAAAEGSSRARVPGSSGTAQQSLKAQGFDARSISSSIRSVNQGRSSLIGEFLYQAQGILRNRSANMQKGAIAQLENEVINNPGMAADLLERFNPVDFAAKKRMLTQKYGVRATQFLNVLDEGDDEVKDAITRQPLELTVRPQRAN